MSATMLQLIQQAATEMGISVPTSVAGNQNQDVVQLLGLLNAVGYELQREQQWQWMTKQHLITTAYTTTTGNLTSGSAVVTGIPSTAGLSSNYQAVGDGINNATFIESVDSGTQVTLSQPATENGTGVSITFSQVKYALPSDFDRVIDRTDWDKSQHWEMLGPETPQQWQWLISGYISTGPRVRYRLLDNLFQIWPALGSVHTLGFEYISNAWVRVGSATEPTLTSFTADTQTCVFPDRLMVLGLKLKYFEIKSFDTTALWRDYTRHLEIAKAADAGSPNLSFAPRISTVLIGWENIPDSGYGS